MKIVFIGAVKFSASALRELISMGAEVVGVCTLKSSNFNADHQDLSPIAKAFAIPVCPTTDLNSQEGIDWIKSQLPDVIFCFGWSRLIRDPLLSLTAWYYWIPPAALPQTVADILFWL